MGLTVEPPLDQSIGLLSCTNQTAKTMYNNNFSALPNGSPRKSPKNYKPRVPSRARNHIIE
jgi:hypothetical protein